MPRTLLRLPLFVVALFACVLQPRAQIVNITPHCDDVGVLAWGKFGAGVSSPSALKSTCAGTVPLPGIINATDGNANQLAAFSAGRGVAFNGSVSWPGATPLTIAFPPAQTIPLKVWVLYKNTSTNPCDLACIRMKMANFVVWANDRLSAERTGIQLAPFDADWVSEPVVPPSSPVHQLLDFRESDNTDCDVVGSSSFPAAMRQSNALNIYFIRTVGGQRHRGIYCDPARDAGFANAFVASQATNSTILHELSHNLGLDHSPGTMNVMNQTIDYGVFFTEGQSFWMNYSSHSAMLLTLGIHVADMRNCDDFPPVMGCVEQERWIWPDP